MQLHAGEGIGSWKIGELWQSRHASRQHQLGGMQRLQLTAAAHLHGPQAGAVIRAGVVAGADAFRIAPPGQFHHLDVHLQPVAHLVLGSEDRPMVGKRQIRQMVVPDRVVQAQGLVAPSPCVSRAFEAIDHQGGNTQAFQPRRQADAALSTADYQAIGRLADT